MDGNVREDLRRIRLYLEQLNDWLADNSGGTDPNALTQAKADLLYLKRTANDFTTFTTKASPAAADVMLIESAADAFAKREITLGTLPLATVYATGRVPLWVPPSVLGLTPGTIDTEFDSNPNWSYYDFTNAAARVPAGTPDERTQNTPSSNVPKISFTQRRSWLRLQPPNIAAGYNAAYYFPSLQTPSLPTWYWAATGGENGTSSTNSPRLGLCLWANNSGVPDNTNNVWVGYSNDQSLHGHSVVSNVDGAIGAVSAFNVSNTMWPYVGLYKTSARVEFYAFDDNGQFWNFGSVAETRTSFWVGLRLVNQDSAVPFTIHEADFVRQRTGSSPPWVR